MKAIHTMLKRFYRFEIVFPVAVLLIIVIAIFMFVGRTPVANISISEVEEVGLVENPSRPELIRDGGSGAIVNGKYLWVFGDTLFNPKSVDGTNGRTMTAAYADLSNPISLTEALDANRAPQQFIPLSAADKAYNDSTKKGDDRYAIWPGLIIPRPDKNDALVYFVRLKVNPGGGGLNYDILNTGIARVADGADRAEVVVENLFVKPETLYSGGGFVKDGYAYFYSCSSRSSSQCSIARAETKDALEKNKYTFWDGKKWQGDISKAIAKFPGTSTGTSLGYIESKKQYVVFYNAPFSKDMYFATSKNVTGPYSAPKKFYSAEANNYALTYQSDLTDENDRLLLTYYQPRSGMHAIKLTLE